MNKILVIVLLLILCVGHTQAQEQPYVRKDIDKQLVNPPGFRMMKVGKGLTLGGGVLLVAGIALMASADEKYYTSTTTPYGTEEEGDPKFAFGVLAAVSGVGMIIPGAILWSKGSKKFKAYQTQNPGANLSLGINNNGIGLRFRF